MRSTKKADKLTAIPKSSELPPPGTKEACDHKAAGKRLYGHKRNQKKGDWRPTGKVPETLGGQEGGRYQRLPPGDGKKQKIN